MLKNLKKKILFLLFRGNLLSYILFLRITPFLPNWFINIVSPVIGKANLQDCVIFLFHHDNIPLFRSATAPLLVWFFLRRGAAIVCVHSGIFYKEFAINFRRVENSFSLASKMRMNICVEGCDLLALYTAMAARPGLEFCIC